VDTGGGTLGITTSIITWADNGSVYPTIKGNLLLGLIGFESLGFNIQGETYIGLDMQAQVTLSPYFFSLEKGKTGNFFAPIFLPAVLVPGTRLRKSMVSGMIVRE
jgi:hypothetical protein